MIARRHGSDWYVGAMTDWTARELAIDLSFLSSGASGASGAPASKWQMTAYADGPSADKPSEYRKTTVPVGPTTKLTVKLASGGGWVARIRP